jgi:hypothetical protein
MGRAVPNTINSWQRNRNEFPTCNSLRAILLVRELISIEYNVGQPDGSTTINEINVGYSLLIKRNGKWMYNVTLRPARVTTVVLE